MNARRLLLLAAALGAVSLLSFSCEPATVDPAVLAELRALRASIEHRGTRQDPVDVDVGAAFAPLRSALAEIAQRQQDDRARLAGLATDVRTLIDGGRADEPGSTIDADTLTALRQRVDTLERELRAELQEQRQAQELVLAALDLTTDKLQAFLTKLDGVGAVPRRAAASSERAGAAATASRGLEPVGAGERRPPSRASLTPESDGAEDAGAGSLVGERHGSEGPKAPPSAGAGDGDGGRDVPAAATRPALAERDGISDSTTTASPRSVATDDEADRVSPPSHEPAAVKRGEASLEAIVGAPETPISARAPFESNGVPTEPSADAAQPRAPERTPAEDGAPTTRPPQQPQQSGLSWLLAGLVSGLGVGLAAAVTVLVLERRRQRARARLSATDAFVGERRAEELAPARPSRLAGAGFGDSFAGMVAPPSRTSPSEAAFDPLPGASPKTEAPAASRVHPDDAAFEPSAPRAPRPRWAEGEPIVGPSAARRANPASLADASARAATAGPPTSPRRRQTADPPLTYAQHVPHACPAAFAAEVSRWLADDPAVLTEPPPRVLVTADGIDVRFHLAPEHAAHGGRLDGELAALAREVAASSSPSDTAGNAR